MAKTKDEGRDEEAESNVSSASALHSSSDVEPVEEDSEDINEGENVLSDEDSATYEMFEDSNHPRFHAFRRWSIAEELLRGQEVQRKGKDATDEEPKVPETYSSSGSTSGRRETSDSEVHLYDTREGCYPKGKPSVFSRARWKRTWLKGKCDFSPGRNLKLMASAEVLMIRRPK